MNISKSILSITSPGTYLVPNDTDLNIKITTETNDELAAICQQHPDRFKFFASLPLPGLDESVAEIDRALDQIGAVGFTIMSNSAGVYPGDKKFKSVWDKLNERNAIVLLHPTSCHLCDGHGHAESSKPPSARPTPAILEHSPIPGFPNPMLEFPFETTRAMVSLILSGTLQRCSNVKVIIPHAGAVIPPLIARFATFSTLMARFPGSSVVAVSIPEVKAILNRQCFFDLAGMPFPDQIGGLLGVVPNKERILFGTDFPYTPPDSLLAAQKMVDGAMMALFGENTGKILMTNIAQVIPISKL
ncbi:uncharacterized protein Z518_10413 [Rhinocladiella mackenziei CBS 650.93]|uniref:6-methylsalicylate decarboxylase n=1 Tax=Rhinocladiella mackenziei CBS 650.93 TaxID=1442369 RepID=A0A0D2I3C3_9EURO|nr:uncharacterized protein Z518_10413 [Rhinocladiella mackenziei CBS 650.93]KIX00274.1 hypothetical protein Z518_10413 [Rhinocladiella mackenziei CBS 650.93]